MAIVQNLDSHLRKPCALVAAAAMTLTLLAACGSGDDTGDASDSDKLTEIVLGPARLESITNAAVVVGHADGVFKSCDLDATLKPSGGGGNQVQALESGAIDFIFPSLSAVIPAYLKGANITIVAGESQGTNGMAWLTLKDSPLASVKDLKGKKVSVSAINSNTDSTFNRVLKKNGMAPDDVKKVVIADVGAGLSALASKTVDAIWATEPSVTLFENSGEAKVVFRSDDFIDDNQLTVVAVRKDYAEKNHDLVVRTLKCLQKTRDIAEAETDRVAKEFAASAKLDPEVAADVLKRSVGNDESTMDLTVLGIQAALDGAISSKTVPADTTLDSLKDLFTVFDDAGIKVVGGSL